MNQVTRYFKAIRRRLLPRYDEALKLHSYLEQMEFQPSNIYEEDCIVVGYPKSGNTWFQNLICGVAYDIDTSNLPQKLVGHLVPDVMAYPYYQRYFSPTYFKSHYLPRPNYRKVVYLVRDGRDALVSYYHFRKAMGFSGDWHQLLQSLGETTFGKWHSHVESWLQNPYQAMMIIIRYEDLLAHPLQEMQRFAEFASIERTQKQLEAAISNASFQRMRQREDIHGMLKGFPPEKRFIRRGQAGSHEDEMPQEILALFMEEAEATLRKLGYISD